MGGVWFDDSDKNSSGDIPVVRIMPVSVCITAWSWSVGAPSLLFAVNHSMTASLLKSGVRPCLSTAGGKSSKRFRQFATAGTVTPPARAAMSDSVMSVFSSNVGSLECERWLCSCGEIVEHDNCFRSELQPARQRTSSADHFHVHST